MWPKPVSPHQSTLTADPTDEEMMKGIIEEAIPYLMTYTDLQSLIVRLEEAMKGSLLTKFMK